jgi:hypothetical protein
MLVSIRRKRCRRLPILSSRENGDRSDSAPGHGAGPRAGAGFSTGGRHLLLPRQDATTRPKTPRRGDVAPVCQRCRSVQRSCERGFSVRQQRPRPRLVPSDGPAPEPASELVRFAWPAGSQERPGSQPASGTHSHRPVDIMPRRLRKALPPDDLPQALGRNLLDLRRRRTDPVLLFVESASPLRIRPARHEWGPASAPRAIAAWSRIPIPSQTPLRPQDATQRPKRDSASGCAPSRTRMAGGTLQALKNRAWGPLPGLYKRPKIAHQGLKQDSASTFSLLSGTPQAEALEAGVSPNNGLDELSTGLCKRFLY